MPQWTAAKGGSEVGNFVHSPSFTWTPFADTAAGSGTFTGSLQQNRFWTGRNTAAVQRRVGFLAPPSDWPGNQTNVNQLTYTHTLPGAWRWLAVTAGQYSFGTYDQNDYAGNAQTNFVNYALAQNATQTYTTSDLGGFVEATSPDNQWTLAGGVQGATNLAGDDISTRGLATGRLATFAAVQFTALPLGANYSLMWYRQPAVPAQPSASHGVSLSMTQTIAKNLGVLLRVNTATGSASPIASSVAGGIVADDPLARGEPDQIGLGIAWNQTNLKALGQPARRSELVAELYANYAVFRGLKIGPDIQLYDHPALATGAGMAAVFTLRATASF